jgi:NAD(P)-dependent dehydrogenase (short-subunit alcohol dehydrogenase family)
MTRTLFVTGADMGLGYSLVRMVLGAGDRVVAGVFQSAEKLEAIARIEAGALEWVPLDVTDLDSVREAARRTSEKTSSLDILINNAGIIFSDNAAPLEELDLSNMHLEKTMEVNAFGPLRVTQQFLPLLEKGKQKLIINISSEAGSITDCTRTAWFSYNMSKTALNMQAKILQNYLGPRGYKILAIHPGWMRTSMGGPEADINPDETAEGIYQLAGKSWKVDDPIYMDYQGKPLPW